MHRKETGPAEETIIFETRGLIKTYIMGEVTIEALRGIDLSLREGELTVILGPSGCGKSTLLNILGGLDIATEGSVTYRGRDMTHATEKELTDYRRHQVGFVFQSYNMIPSLTARENVAIVTDIARNPLSPEAALELVGLQERMDHFPAQLSGGEQQRVAIARAIAKRPTVLLCDEPTGALDSKTSARVLEAIQEINTNLGTTTALITHNEVIGEMAHRILRMRDGRIAEERSNEHRKNPHDLDW